MRNPLTDYRSKDNRQEKIFEALDWLAAMTSHIPNRGEQMVRYYGWGHRQKENTDGLIPRVIEQDEKARPNRNWARLIQKIYEVDPLTCPNCRGIMHIISVIEDQAVVDKILSRLGLNQKPRDPHPNPNRSKFS